MTERCSLVSTALDEPLPGTATHAPAWLLIEDPGPWGPEAILGCTIEAEVARDLAERAAAAGVRIQLIRRPSHNPDVEGVRVVFLVHSGPSEPWARRLEVPEEELADLDPLLARRETPPPGLGEAVGEDILLVCTHAKRDACCAQHGRPVAEAMAKRAPAQTWETSHTGGHRFAAVVIALPEGLTFGRLVRRDVPTLLNALAQDRIPLANYRGRSVDAGPGQAAEVAVRRGAKAQRRGAVRVVEITQDGGANVVLVDAEGVGWRAIVASRPLGTLRIVSCGGTPEDRLTHEVIGVAKSAPAAAPTHI